MSDRIWEIRNPDGGAMGLEVARGRAGDHDVMLAHAMPERIDVIVTDADGAVIASGNDLWHEVSTPISRLTIKEGTIRRENFWPSADEMGLPLILPGGEIGLLTAWWNAEDHSEWRWSIELHNHA